MLDAYWEVPSSSVWREHINTIAAQMLYFVDLVRYTNWENYDAGVVCDALEPYRTHTDGDAGKALFLALCARDIGLPISQAKEWWAYMNPET